VQSFSWFRCYHHTDTHPSHSAAINKHIVIDAEGKKTHGDVPQFAKNVKFCRTGDEDEKSTLQHKYKEMLYVFGPCIVGMTNWTTTKATGAISSVLTVTDEAFINVAIQNYSSRWDLMAERLRWHQPMVPETI
jgi:hypothetical protein